MKNVLKTIAMTIAAIASGVVAIISDGTPGNVQWINFSLLVVASISVYVVPNIRNGGSEFAKATVAGLTAALTLAVSLIADGQFDPSDWIQVIVALLGAGAVLNLRGPIWFAEKGQLAS